MGLPVTGALWIIGLLAITGSPPFGTFLSELAILKGILDAGRPLVAVFYLTAVLAHDAEAVLRVVTAPVAGAACRSWPSQELNRIPSSARRTIAARLANLPQ